MLQIEVSIGHLDELLKDLAGVIQELNTKVLIDDAGAFMLNRIRTRFLKELDPDDKPWKPSKAAVKRRKEGGTGTLFDTGRLFRSIQFASGEGTGGEGTVSTDVEYAPYLHYGFKHPGDGSQVGPWPFMGISDQDVQTLELILIRRVEQLIDEGLDGKEY